jgi:hypothetical protein
MKKNKFKKLVNEGMLDTIKQSFQGPSKREQIHKLFVTDFIDDALVSLKAGIDSGAVNIKLVGSTPTTPTTPPAPPEAEQPTLPIDVNEDNSAYKRLNFLFEQIMQEIDEPTQQTQQSISQYLGKFWKNYMKPISTPTEYNSQLNALFTEVEKTYPKDKGKAALTKLGNLAFAISSASSKGQASGASNVTQAQKGKQSSVQAKALANDIRKALVDLESEDPNVYNYLISILQQKRPATFTGTNVTGIPPK